MPAADSPDHPDSPHARLFLLIPAAFLAAVVTALSLGDDAPLSARAAALVSVTLHAGWTPAAYLLGAIGWGVPARRLTLGVPGASAINAALGLAATLTVTHALGVLGLLHPLTAWLWTGAGLVLLGSAVVRGRSSWPALRTALRTGLNRPLTVAVLALASVGVGVMLVAAASPPGALWDSEFGGYDALSYHLQLPAEWMDARRIMPFEHNVYSFLPGYMEAATVHLGALAGAPARTPAGLTGMLAGSGDLVMAPHFLALGVTVLGAWFIGAFAGVLFSPERGASLPPDRARPDALLNPEPGSASRATTEVAALAAAALALLTPWTQVVGSMAYNEPGVVALGAGALAAAFTPGLSPARRGVLVAALVGAACGCKPTAILFLAPGAAVGMAVSLLSRPVPLPGGTGVPPVSSSPRDWLLCFGLGALTGLLMIAPWLARNQLSAGNPIFPQATLLLGDAHWTPDQTTRYAAAHHFDAPWLDRLEMLLLPDPKAPAEAPTVARLRGLTNPQWALTPWLGLGGCIVLITRRRTRRVGLALPASIGVGCLAWMLATHLQSRFLLPLLPLFAAGFGAGVAGLAPRPRTILTVAALSVSAAWSVWNFSAQRAGNPNALLALGPGVFSGRLTFEGVGDAFFWAGVNQTAPSGALLLVGDATPLYLRAPTVYATVWDTHPLASAMQDHPDDPNAWTDALRATGIEWALVSFPELARLEASGWSHPMLTPERVAGWSRSLGEPARAWPDQGRYLFRLGDSPR